MRGFKGPLANPPGQRHGSLGSGGRRLGGAASVAVICAGLLAACGSSPTSTSALHSTCQQVSAVLSDGPDPDADPVGYAQAQVLPLSQIHTSDTSLRSAIAELASAYQRFVAANGAKAANDAVNKAADKVNAICPGSAS